MAICPSPPALLPGATGALAVPEIERLRECAAQTVAWLCAPGEPVLALAAGRPRHIDEGTRVSAEAFGLGFQARLGGDGDEPAPTLAPTEPGPIVAAYLLDGHPASALLVRDADDVTSDLGALATSSLLVIGGGSARRRPGAPGHLDPRAVPYDDQLVAQIAQPDLDALSAPDFDLAAELLADLPAPLSVAARLLRGRDVRAQVESYEAPFGVASIVARWWADD